MRTWERHILEAELNCGMVKRLNWFWNYIIRKKPMRMVLSVIVMGEVDSFLEDVKLRFFTGRYLEEEGVKAKRISYTKGYGCGENP